MPFLDACAIGIEGSNPETALMLATEIQEFFFNWYPVFGVIFSGCLIVIFLKLMRSTVGSPKPETVKASKTEPVLWDEVQEIDAAKDELMDVAAWLREPQ